MASNRVSDEQLLEIILANPGQTALEIGQKAGLSRVQVSRRRNSESFQNLLHQHHTEQFEVLKLVRMKAVQKVCQLVNSDDERLALKACEVILNPNSLSSLEKYYDRKRNESSLTDQLLENLRKYQKMKDSYKNHKGDGSYLLRE